MDWNLKDAYVTCRTPGCGNKGHAIPAKVDAENPSVWCGVCGKEITDIVDDTESVTK